MSNISVHRAAVVRVGKYLLVMAPVVGAGALLWNPVQRAEAGRPGVAFCLTAPAEARVGPGQKADRTASVDVPRETPAWGATASSQAVREGEVIRVKVRSPRRGELVVHGLTDALPVKSGMEVEVAFRMIYTGRFPLHFHGDDGSHFELVAFEAWPKG